MTFWIRFYSFLWCQKKLKLLQSQKPNSKAVKWICDGSPNYSIEETNKKTKGTDIILHIDEDSQEFLEERRIQEILNRYCKFLPVEVKFGTKKIFVDDPKARKMKKVK